MKLFHWSLVVAATAAFAAPHLGCSADSASNSGAKDAGTKDSAVKLDGSGGTGGSGGIGGSGGSGGGSTGQCGLTSQNAACDACIAGACCNEGLDCSNDSTCGDALTCIQACASGDTACENSCLSTAGGAKLNTFFTCLSNSCATECGGGGTGGTGGSGGGSTQSCGLTTNNATCDDCLNTSCCNEQKSCIAQQTTCLAALNCIANCAGDQTCAQNCLTSSPEAAAVESCAGTNCATACGQ